MQEQVGLARFATRKLQHVVDDVADAAGVRLDNVGEALVVFAEPVRLAEQLCAAWLIAPTGFLISWAILALSRPSDASFDCWTRALNMLVSSRKISSGPPRSPPLPSGARCAVIRALVPSLIEGELRDVRTKRVILAPASQVLCQWLGCFAQAVGNGTSCGRAEQPGGRCVAEPDLVVCIHDDNALAQVLHDILVQFG